MPEQPDMFGGDGRAGRDEGIKRVLNNVSPHWRTAYVVTVFHWFARLPVGFEFTGEDLRRHAQPLIGNPHHHNAWGGQANALIGDWLKTNKIIRCGMRQAVTGQAHARSYPLYRKVSP